MEGVLDILLSAAFWAAAVRIATPLILGTLGELLCERAGVLNLGIEGIMTAGAMSGWLAVYQGADLWTGVAIAAAVGMAFGLLHGVFTVPLGLSQHVTGIGITLLATSLAYFTYRMVLPEATSPPRIAGVRSVRNAAVRSSATRSASRAARSVTYSSSRLRSSSASRDGSSR